jgi:hypothetical protein
VSVCTFQIGFKSRVTSGLCFGFILVFVAHLAAADPPWSSKPTALWTEEDARQILTASPWVKNLTAVITRRLTEDELREAGQMGQPKGVGYDGVDPKGSGPTVSANILTGAGGDDRSLRSRARPIKLKLRWESAAPVRIAEMKSPAFESAALDGNGYQIAVYGIPGSNVAGTPEKLGEPLKKTAALKREGKKDAKPERVEVLQREDGIAVVYVFPLSAEISKSDGLLLFEAQIGRISISQTFDLRDMEFMGKLEL